MTPRALIVDDDEQVVQTIEDTLVSLEHEHAWVTNQLDAQQLLRRESFDYVLLDLEIPARPNRRGAVTGDKANAPPFVTGDTQASTADNLTERQRWVLDTLRSGARLQRAALEQQFGVHADGQT